MDKQFMFDAISMVLSGVSLAMGSYGVQVGHASTAFLGIGLGTYIYVDVMNERKKRRDKTNAMDKVGGMS